MLNVTTIAAQTSEASAVGATAQDVVAPAAEDKAYRAQVQRAAEQFESFFISQMLRQMRSATREVAGDDSVYDSNTHSDMLDFADTSFADAMAQQRAFGIADVIVQQLLPQSKLKP
jgi:flagellar protein FlgJ